MKISQADLKHAKNHINLIYAWNNKINTSQCPEALAQLNAKLGNIKVAFERVADRNYINEPTLVRDYGISLFDYFDAKGHWDEWQETYSGPSLQACLELGDDYSLKEAYPTLYGYIGITQRMAGKYDEAIKNYKEGLNHAVYNPQKIDLLTNLADVYRLKGSSLIEEGLSCGKQAFELSGDLNDLNRKAKILQYLGLIYLYQYDWDNAIKSYNQAIELYNEKDNLRRISLVKSMLAYALTLRGQVADLYQALAYYDEVEKIDIQLKNNQAFGRYWGDKAAVFNKLGLYQIAKDFSDRANEYNKLATNTRGSMLNRARLVESCVHLKEFEEAENHLEIICSNRHLLTNFDLKAIFKGFHEAVMKLLSYLRTNDSTKDLKKYLELLVLYANELKNAELISRTNTFINEIENEEGQTL